MGKFLSCIGLILLVFGAQEVSSQSINFTASAPQIVAVDEVFRVEFTLNAKPETFTPPAFTGVDVVAGPTSSQGKVVEIINGRRSESFSFTYTYVLQANAVGKLTIPAARVTVSGKSYSTRSLALEVVAEGGNGSRQSSNASSGNNSGQSAAKVKSSLSSDDLLVRISVNRNTVYKGQPILATVKLYTRVPIAGIEGAKYPAFNGFWTQELPGRQNAWQRETFNNKVYDATVITQYLLYPQQSGVLQIERMDLDVVAQLMSQQGSQSMFDAFFGGQAVENVRKKISSTPLRITVKALPSGAPDGFTGAVGNFTMTGKVSDSKFSANSAANYTLRISGTGNMPLINAPTLTLPTSFEQYNVKTTDNFNNTVSGTTGYKEFEYPFIARGEGTFTLDPITFSYFDPQRGRYMTLSTQTESLEVLRDSTGGGVSGGMVSGINKEDLKILGQDIRFIYTGNPGLHKAGSFFVGSLGYWGLLLLLLGLFAGMLVYMKKQIRQRHNLALIRNKRAQKAAFKRLKRAEANMQTHQDKGFYEELLKAMWGYMSDKLNIPVSGLSKENVREGLLRRGVALEDISAYLELIESCEFAQYAPVRSTSVSELYDRAVKLIARLESVL